MVNSYLQIGNLISGEPFIARLNDKGIQEATFIVLMIALCFKGVGLHAVLEYRCYSSGSSKMQALSVASVAIAIHIAIPSHLCPPNLTSLDDLLLMQLFELEEIKLCRCRWDKRKRSFRLCFCGVKTRCATPFLKKCSHPMIRTCHLSKVMMIISS